MSDYVIDLFDVFRIIKERILIVVISVLAFVAVSVVKSFLTPATYRSEATMSLPTAANPFLLKRLDENTQAIVNDYIINVAETRELLYGLSDDGYKALHPYIVDPSILADLIEVRVDGIFGTDKYFRMIVKGINHPNSATDIIWGLAGYLNNHPLLTGQLSEDKNRPLSATRELVEKTTPSGGHVRTGPENTYRPGYLFIRKPVVNTTPIRPKPLLDGVMMGLAGFLAGCLVALAYQMLAERKRNFASE